MQGNEAERGAYYTRQDPDENQLSRAEMKDAPTGTASAATTHHIVESIAHAVETRPEGVVEEVLGLGANKHLERIDLECRIHDGRHRRRRLGLGLADIVLAKQELARQVRQLDAVGVGDGQRAVRAAADRVERKVLHKLAPERAAPDHKVLQV